MLHFYPHVIEASQIGSVKNELNGIIKNIDKIKLTLLNVMESATVSTRHHRIKKQNKQTNNYLKQPSINLVLTGILSII